MLASSAPLTASALTDQVLGAAGMAMLVQVAFMAGTLWKLWVNVGTHHLIGALLCAPAVFGLLPWPLACFLARLAGLLEVGWEIQDFTRVAIDRMSPGGAKRQPNAALIMNLLHHAMGCGMVIPMNLYFPEETAYFQLILLLQGAAAITMLLGLYADTLDCGCS